MPKIHNLGRNVGGKHIALKIIMPKAWDEKGKPVLNNEEGSEHFGKPVTITIMPGQHCEVDDTQFKHLKELFGAEIVNLDDAQDMRGQFKETAATKSRPAGYFSPEEVENEKQKAVREELEKRGIKVEAAEGDTKPPQEGGQSDRITLAQKIDKMDRAEIVALIEEGKLNIEHKSVRIDTLKALVLEALEKAQKAA